MSEKEQEQVTNQMQEEQKKKRKKIVIIILLLLLIIAAVVIFLIMKRPKRVMTEENYKQISEEMDEQVQEGYFETYMNTDWTFPNGASESTNAILGNSPNNKKPIRCEVILADTEEVIYSTEVLPVGAELPPFKLDVDLDAGTYDAVCMVYLLDEEDDGSYTDYSNAGFNVTITVEN
jgi:hypothetical protein